LKPLRRYVLLFLFIASADHPSSGQPDFFRMSTDIALDQKGSLDIFCPAPAIFGGKRDAAEVTEVIQRKISYFANCYSENISKEELLEFKIRVRLVIKPGGNVSEAGVIFNGTNNGSFLSCLRSIFYQMQFKSLPGSSGDSVVEQSLLFRILK